MACSRRTSWVPDVRRSDVDEILEGDLVEDAVLPSHSVYPNMRHTENVSSIGIDRILKMISNGTCPFEFFDIFLNYAFKNEQHEIRLHYMTKLKAIATSFGDPHTRITLIPFLAQLSNILPESLSIILIEQLWDIAEYLGGKEHCLLPLLTNLAINGNSSVQRHAVECIRKVAFGFSNIDAELHLMSLIRKMCNSFRTRELACALISICYKLAEDLDKQDLIRVFRTLCEDIDPLVRHAAVFWLGDFIKDISPEVARSDVIPMLKKLAKDDSIPVRLQAAVVTLCLPDDDDPNEKTSLFGRAAQSKFHLWQPFPSIL